MAIIYNNNIDIYLQTFPIKCVTAEQETHSPTQKQFSRTDADGPVNSRNQSEEVAHIYTEAETTSWPAAGPPPCQHRVKVCRQKT